MGEPVGVKKTNRKRATKSAARKTAARKAGRAKSKVAAKPAQKLRRPPGDGEAPHENSLTALAAEAWRTGVLPGRSRQIKTQDRIPGEDEKIRAGDPDDDSLANEYVGDETPGGSASTPDQNEVDQIGRAYGLQEEDTGSLRTAEEVLTRRDRHRVELKPPGRPRA